MRIYNKATLGERAKELGVVRDTYEKVCRLSEILRYFDGSEELKNCLALKGGTAINLTIFNLPRLSVDIDLDFTHNVSRDEMLIYRERIRSLIEKKMVADGYQNSDKSKYPHSLDSFVYSYSNSAGMRDNIKIEINYSLRSHVLPLRYGRIDVEGFDGSFGVTTLSPIEIYATKVVALLTRAAARDLYDMNYMVRHGLFDDSEQEMLKRCVVFYLAVATETTPKIISYSIIERITNSVIHTDLYPVLRRKEGFNLDDAKHNVTSFLSENILNLNENEWLFLSEFSQGRYRPELVFEQQEIVERIKSHPMAMWKIKKIKDRNAR